MNTYITGKTLLKCPGHDHIVNKNKPLETNQKKNFRGRETLKTTNYGRLSVLQSFKNLHKTRKRVFKGDEKALQEARKQINEEYKKFKNTTNPKGIQELIEYAIQVEKELRTCVIQAREVAPGKFQAEITSDTIKIDNVPYKEQCCGGN
ncbi:unnamed protein product [Callosobruchus maculatus]|uniref:Uncharacterized protein n=1 Tax=Callosobruchus maculatus TaxID=64391 RepID=A0A653C8G3_CALMS|nr:unnamed protein product [Callosobruchus maculatus]